MFEFYIVILIVALVASMLGVLLFFALLEEMKDHDVIEQINEAKQRIDAEEHRFRVGEIDRRNLQQ